jgi:hypothetical protein
MPDYMEARVIEFRPRAPDKLRVKLCREVRMGQGAESKPEPALPYAVHTDKFVELMIDVREIKVTLTHVLKVVDAHTELLNAHTEKLNELYALKNKLIGAAMVGGLMFSGLLFLAKALFDRFPP